MGKLRILGLMSVLGTAAMIAGVGSSAQAHEICAAVHGADNACVFNAHSHLSGCDREADGHGVRAHWRTAGGNIGVTGWDPDGAGGPLCGHGDPPSTMVEYRVCENDVGCSDWKPE